ncbi:hypothetical protein ACJMK2_018782 [Sinanodonta woodiana]|uniref:TIR domain-containing protein n=1 Tax=Sinanodonta woodiana TaxID=1069815 RepID=A0ABD3UGH3_SINWO
MCQRMCLIGSFVVTVILFLVKECTIVKVSACQTDCIDVKCPTHCNCMKTRADCHGRNLTYIPRIPCGIKYLYFFNNNVSTLGMKEISNLTCSFETITHISLRKCKLEQMDENVFANLTQLEILDLSGNRLLNKSKGLQSALGKLNRAPLHTLILDHVLIQNEVQEIFKYFEGSHLTFLSMRENQIIEFDVKVLKNFTKLVHLDLHGNWINKIDLSSGIETLELFNLSHNHINIFPQNFCDTKTGQTRYNKLRNLDLYRNKIILSYSPNWNCLKTLETLNLSRNDIEDITRNYSFANLTSLKTLILSEMKCSLRKIRKHAFESDSLQHLDLSSNGLNFEERKKVENDVFHYLPNLTLLDLSQNEIGSSFVQTTSRLSRLETLIMRQVSLRELPDNFLEHIPNLKHLDLSSNKIVQFSINFFRNLTKLKVLNMSENYISNFPAPPFPPSTLKSLDTFDFADNALQCDCEIVKLQKWINDVLSDPGKQNMLSRYPDGYRCLKPESMYHVLLKNAEPNNCNNSYTQLLISGICSAIICLAFTVVLVVAFIYRWEIKFLLHKMRQKRCNGYNPLTDTFEYSSYLVYAEKDSAWVIHDLLKELKEDKYNIYIRDRYSVPGVARCDEIVDNIYKSKTVIIVLSKNFMACQWCNYQMNVAQARAIKLGPRFLIPVLLEGICFKNMTMSVQHLFRTSKPIEWAQRRTKNRLFWSELKTALDAEINQEFEETGYQSFVTGQVSRD